jgi:predicted dienelactone hydrolase
VLLRWGLLPAAQNQRALDRAGAAETVEIAGRRVSVWRPPARNVRAPLVIFSHGFHGSSTQSVFLLKALAAAGYLVLAPNHKDALGGNAGSIQRPEVAFRHPESWTDATYRDRAEDITDLLKALKSGDPWAREIEWTEVGLVGHSLGGYTVLGLAGGWPRWRIADVKAVIALSPYAAPFIRHRSLGALRVPVMYQGGTRDIGISPSLGKGGGAYDLTGSPAYYIEFLGAGHFAWTDLIPHYQSSISEYCLAFFNKYLRDDRTVDPAMRRADVADLRAK